MLHFNNTMQLDLKGSSDSRLKVIASGSNKSLIANFYKMFCSHCERSDSNECLGFLKNTPGNITEWNQAWQR